MYHLSPAEEKGVEIYRNFLLTERPRAEFPHLDCAGVVMKVFFVFAILWRLLVMPVVVEILSFRIPETVSDFRSRYLESIFLLYIIITHL